VSPEVQIITRAISNPIRLEALALLYETPMSAGALTYLLEGSQSAIAHHLAILRQAGLIRREREGVHVIYELADTRTRIFARSLTNLLR
jgi:DNA-binding transcriptional ArsR family regulator